MTITKTTKRHGIVVAEVLHSDMRAASAKEVMAEMDAVDPGAEALLAGYVREADSLIQSTPAGSARRQAARTMRVHARAAIEYLQEGNAEGATWNALQAARAAWLADVKLVEPDVVTGRKATRQRSRAGFGSGEERKATRQPEWARWQNRADELHASNPRRSKSDICQQVAEENGMTRRAVAKRVELVGTERPRSKK